MAIPLILGLSLATFSISATAENSEVSCCLCWTFKGTLDVDWQTLPKVFGITVDPREVANLALKSGRTVTLTVNGNILPGLLNFDKAVITVKIRV